MKIIINKYLYVASAFLNNMYSEIARRYYLIHSLD